MDERLAALVPTFGSAELLTCGVIRTKAKESAPNWGFNAFSVLTFLDTRVQSLTMRHVTSALENAPKGEHRLFVSISTLTVPEAISLMSFRDYFKDPRAPVTKPPLESFGVWVGPEFVGREEHPARDCVATADPFWLAECWRTRPSELDDELDPDVTEWLRDRIGKHTGIALEERRERLGNFMIVMPDHRHRLRVTWSRGGKVGVELRDRPGYARRFSVVVRGQRDGHLVAATVREVHAGLHVFAMPEAVDHRAVEVYDAETGHIVDCDAHVPMREIRIAGQIASTKTDFTFRFSGGDEIRTRSMWGTTIETTVGDRSAWEERLTGIKDREQKEALRAGKRLFVYRGSEAERRQAISDLQGILHSNISGYVKIWDPYFGAREAAEFLNHIFDPDTQIMILTSLEVTPQDRGPGSSEEATMADPVAVESTASRRSAKHIELQKVLDTLRKPTPSIEGQRNLKCAIGGEMFHDRFVITRDRCWQLGCSFNQIGRVMSTIIDFPYPSLIEHEFDLAFKAARNTL